MVRALATHQRASGAFADSVSCVGGGGGGVEFVGSLLFYGRIHFRCSGFPLQLKWNI